MITPDNTQPYEYVFFPMFESQYYPRRYREEFPFSHEILDILNTPKYGFKGAPSHRQGIAVHMDREQYLMQNVLDFTQGSLILTLTERADEAHNAISFYGHSFATAFDSEIPWEAPCYTKQLQPNVFQADRVPRREEVLKDTYTVLELLLHKLCPRLYRHWQAGPLTYNNKFQLQFYFAAVLYSATLNAFKAYNEREGKVYHVDENEAYDIVTTLLESAFVTYESFFSQYNSYEMSDIRISVLRRLKNQFEHAAELHRKGKLGEYFTIINPTFRPEPKGQGYSLVLEYDMELRDINKGTGWVSQSDAWQAEAVNLKVGKGAADSWAKWTLASRK